MKIQFFTVHATVPELGNSVKNAILVAEEKLKEEFNLWGVGKKVLHRPEISKSAYPMNTRMGGYDRTARYACTINMTVFYEEVMEKSNTDSVRRGSGPYIKN